MSDTYTEVEWSGLKQIDLTQAAAVRGTKYQIQVNMPDGVILIRDFAMSYDRSAVADMLRRAAAAVDKESRLRPIEPGIPMGPRQVAAREWMEKQGGKG